MNCEGCVFDDVKINAMILSDCYVVPQIFDAASSQFKNVSILWFIMVIGICRPLPLLIAR